MAKIIGNTTATPMPRPDWNQTDPTKADYIKNKPDINGGGNIGNFTDEDDGSLAMWDAESNCLVKSNVRMSNDTLLIGGGQSTEGPIDIDGTLWIDGGDIVHIGTSLEFGCGESDMPTRIQPQLVVAETGVFNEVSLGLNDEVSITGEGISMHHAGGDADSKIVVENYDSGDMVAICSGEICVGQNDEVMIDKNGIRLSGYKGQSAYIFITDFAGESVTTLGVADISIGLNDEVTMGVSGDNTGYFHLRGTVTANDFKTFDGTSLVAQIGNIETALDSIIAIQESLIGGGA